MSVREEVCCQVFLVVLLLLLLATSTMPTTSHGDNLDVRICPSLEFLENSQLVNNKVFISRSFAGISCYNEFHDRVLPLGNKSVGYYVSVLGQGELGVVESIFTSIYGSSLVNESYVFRGYIIDDVGCRRIVLVVRVPNPLDGRIVDAASKVAEHFGGVCGVDVVLGSPKALEASHAIATVLKQYEKEASMQNATYAVGVDLFALTTLVLADKKFISIVGGVEELAQVIEGSLPEGSWAILVVLSEPLRIEHHDDNMGKPGTVEEGTSVEEAGSMGSSTIVVDGFSHAMNTMGAEVDAYSTMGSANTFTATTAVKVDVSIYSDSTPRSSGMLRPSGGSRVWPGILLVGLSAVLLLVITLRRRA